MAEIGFLNEELKTVKINRSYKKVYLFEQLYKDSHLLDCTCGVYQKYFQILSLLYNRKASNKYHQIMNVIPYNIIYKVKQ